MSIQNTVLNDTDTDVYVSGAPSAVTAIYLCNTDTVPVSFNVFAVKSGASAALTTNVIYRNVEIAPGDTYIIDSEKLILDTGDSIVAYASTTGVIVATVSYLGF